MSTMTTTPSGVLVDPAFVLALENQQRRLSSLLDRIDGVRGRLPSTHAGVWRGPAHTLYAGSVDELARELGAIRDRLDVALAATRAAHSVAAMQG